MSSTSQEMAPQGRWRRWRWRVTAAAGALVAALLAAGAWAETTARRLHLDYRQGPAISTSSLATRPAVVGGVDLTGLDYLPRVLAIHDGVLRTGFGACLLRSERPTILALGDSTTVQGSMEGTPAEFLETWPTRLPVGPDAQVCTLAEVGYHPSDLATLVAAFGDRLRADRTVLLLCGNDLGGQAPRAFLQVAGRWSLVEAPRTFRYWRRLWSPWLAERSEAYRFASFTMANRSGEYVERPAPAPLLERRTADHALRSLASRDPLVFFLPNLDANWQRPAGVDSLQAASGVTIETIPRPPDPTALRRQPGDTTHLNAAGHAWVAAHIARRLGETAGGAETAGGPAGGR